MEFLKIPQLKYFVRKKGLEFALFYLRHKKTRRMFGIYAFLSIFIIFVIFHLRYVARQSNYIVHEMKVCTAGENFDIIIIMNSQMSKSCQFNFTRGSPVLSKSTLELRPAPTFYAERCNIICATHQANRTEIKFKDLN